MLMRPRRMEKLDEDIRTTLVNALITRFSPLKGPKITTFAAKKFIPTGPVQQWGKLQITEGGD